MVERLSRGSGGRSTALFQNETGEGKFMSDDDLEKLRYSHDKLSEKNTQRANKLAKKGVNLVQEHLTKDRLELLITGLLGGRDSVERIKFETSWQEHLDEVLDQVETKVREQELAHGNGTGKLHIPGRGPRP